MEVNNNICKAVNKRNEHSSTWLNINNIKHYVIPMLLAAVCYSNSLKGEFVHDDIFAIKNNPDANGKSSLSDVWKNDFWGKSIVDFTSHKSYRPITTLTFRLNYVLSGGQPFTFHVVNVLLHCTVTGLFIYLLRQIFNISNQCIFYSSVLFAVHPIHTEAVAGIVGRADVLAAVFFLSAIILYVRSVEKLEYKEDDDIPITIRPVYLFTSILCAIICTLCKEHGIMVLIVCTAVDCLILSKKAVNRILSGELSIVHSKSLFIRIVLLAISFLLVFIIRFIINGGQVPTFLEQDNPASFSSSFLTRVLTYNYLLAFNLWLLFTPITLCYDWQIGSIPLIESFQDQRNLATILFYLLLLFVIRRCFKVFRERDCCNNVVIIATILMCLPFIPASNLFLKVGFVVAERILYIPRASQLTKS